VGKNLRDTVGSKCFKITFGKTMMQALYLLLFAKDTCRNKATSQSKEIKLVVYGDQMTDAYLSLHQTSLLSTLKDHYRTLHSFSTHYGTKKSDLIYIFMRTHDLGMPPAKRL